jgi:Zn-dependent protease with chaperone function
MIVIDGTWYDGKTSTPHPAVLRAYDNGAVAVEASGDGRKLLATTESRLKISPRLANTPRYIYFPDGEKFETDHNDLVDAVAATVKQPSFLNVVHRLETRWRYVTLISVVFVLLLAGFVKYGIPAAAEFLAFRLPPSVMETASRQTLEALDSAVFQPSELPPETQERLLAAFAPVIRRHGQYHPTILFRKGGRVGPNAFALPSGTILFTDEMVALAERDEELVSVLAHEFGHVVHRHALRSLIQKSLLGFTLLAITGDVSGSSELLLGLPVFLTELAYSRDFEREADAYALAYLRSNDLSPHHFAALMGRLETVVEKRQGKKGGGWTSYLSTHPITEERIEAFK